MPPVLIFIIGREKAHLSMESAQYTMYTIDLCARTKGLGCRNLVGNQMFINKNKRIRCRLNPAKNEKIFATMGLTDPSIKFRNKVLGKRISVQWNDQQAANPDTG